MDIIDIMLARAITPQGQTETYVSIANVAAAKAEKAKEDAETAIATVEAAADEIAAAQSEATDLLADARAALETAQAAQINTLDTEDVDAEIKKFDLSYSQITSNSDEYYTNLHLHYPDGSGGTIPSIVALKKATGNSEIAGMTQKAITDALALKADASALAAKADKTYIDQQIAAIPSGGGNNSGGISNLGNENSGRIVVIGDDGNIKAGAIIAEDIINALLSNGGYTARNAVGLEIDYTNKTFTRIQQAVDKSMGSDFDSYLMYGGRKRCMVNDAGEILAFYGDNDYNETGGVNSIMVYQPKFYYQRTPLRISANRVGKVIEKEQILISYEAQTGFKVHPLFINTDGEELDYVLLGAYEGGIYSASANGTFSSVYTNVNYNTDKLTSSANTKPITGSSSLSMERAEQLATNHGTGWHIYTIQAESANQMLEIIEFGSMNGQTALGKGVSEIATNGNYNQAAITGATSSLGNASGSATSTTIETNGSSIVETENGKVSISYRGFENPWGNTWTLLGGIMIYGTTSTNGGVPYICNNYNYSYLYINNNYASAEFSLPNSTGWISTMGYGSKNYDWLFMPAEVGGNANSSLPVGDNGWYDSNLNGVRAVAHGGSWSFEDSNGPFYYACDKIPNDTTYKSYGARLMFIPTKNNIYTANIAKWQQVMNIGG